MYAVDVTRVIDAPPEVVYRIITDMDEHRKILPKEFTGLVVEQGGKGAGTVVLAQMNVMGTKVTNRLTISEPVPGRVMEETDPEAGVRTVWTLSARDWGKRCELHLHSEFRGKTGFAGLMERLVNPAITRSIYRRELELLNARGLELCGAGPG